MFGCVLNYAKLFNDGYNINNDRKYAVIYY